MLSALLSICKSSVHQLFSMAQNFSTMPPHPLVSLPEPKPPHLYFAYGSNLSPTQMSMRLPNSAGSAIPRAVAVLEGWRWIICQRGYANVVKSNEKGKGEGEGEGDVVWGVLYELDKRDEKVLDGFEGVDRRARVGEQGAGDYAKVFLGVRVVRWVGVGGDGKTKKTENEADGQVGADGEGEGEGEEVVPALVYVDFFRTEEGKIQKEYVPRMNRGIRECVPLGVDEEWIGRVLRRSIPEDDGGRRGEGPADRSGVGIGVSGGWRPEQQKE
jgi:hypothetical protein